MDFLGFLRFLIPCELRLEINLSTIQRICRDSRVVQDTRWKDFAASGDEYHFISTRTCELTSEWQGGGPRENMEISPRGPKSRTNQ